MVASGLGQTQPAPRTPLSVARVLAAKYPERPIMSYIPALSWSGSLRLAALTGEDRWKGKPLAEMQPFIAGEKRAIALPYSLTSLAGHLAFADLGAMDGQKAAAALAQTAADFMLGDVPDPNPAAGASSAAPVLAGEVVKYQNNWTDDMFMAASVLARVGAATKNDKYARAAGRLLIGHAEKLQRPDGLFIHAVGGPHAWGRGNGFAALGLLEALTYLPDTWSDRARVLEIYRRHMRALLTHQSDDGSWRQVVDEPSSYRELTVTAMSVAAMARGVRRGWLDRATFLPAIERGWQAVAARVGEDGTVRDVCSSTGAQPAREYYLNRPVVNGADDRGGAMSLLAAIEMEELSRAR